MKSCPINVVIVPSRKAQNVARCLAKDFYRFDNYFNLAEAKDNTLTEAMYVPHVSIYQAQYPMKNIGRVGIEVEELCASQRPFDVEMDNITNHHGYVWWNLKENKSLRKIHEQVLDVLNPLREGLLLPHLTPTGYKAGENFTDEESENVRKYGAVVVDKLFRPHITLARLRKDDNALSAQLREKYGFNVSELSIGDMGDHGTVVGIIESYPFVG